MKKILALLLAIVMVIGMAACNQQTADPTTEATKGTEAPKATDAPETTEAEKDLTQLPLCEPGTEKLVIGIRQNATVLDYHDNDLTLFLEEQTGIDLDFMFFSADTTEARQQLNLMVAGGEKLPDIIKGILDDTMYAELGADGYLVNLRDYFESDLWVWGKYQLENAATEFEQALWWALGQSSDGGIYGYPGLGDGGSVDVCGYLGGINKNWAEQLGYNYEDIDTVAEVKEFLQKAVKHDGNKNGKADELGLVYLPSGYRCNAELWVINAYVRLNDLAIFNVDDGELWAPQITEEYREALIELNSWYKEGLISPLSYSLVDANEFKVMLDTPDCYTVAAFGGHPTLVCTGEGKFGNEYGAIKPLADETGKGGYGLFLNNISVSKSEAISADCENPELAFRFLDWIYGSNQLGARSRAGVPGVNYKYIDGEVEIDGVMTKVYDKDGYPAGWTYIKDEWSSETRITWHEGFGAIQGSLAIEKGLYHAAPNGYTPIMPQNGGQHEVTYGCRFNQNEATHPAESFYNCVYTADELEIKDTYWNTLKQYVAQTRAEFITGIKDPANDDDWQEYLEGLEQEGLYELMEMGQEAYTRTYSGIDG